MPLGMPFMLSFSLQKNTQTLTFITVSIEAKVGLYGYVNAFISQKTYAPGKGSSVRNPGNKIARRGEDLSCLGMI